MKSIRAVLIAASMAVALPAIAQIKPLSNDMQTFVQRVKADKKLIVANAMRLTDAEAKGFWPLYEAYKVRAGARFELAEAIPLVE